MQFLPALPARDYEPCVLEDSQMLHDAEARHLQLRLKLGQGAAVTLKEQVEQEATRRVTERLEHAVLVVAHASTIGDHTVTCQPFCEPHAAERSLAKEEVRATSARPLCRRSRQRAEPRNRPLQPLREALFRTRTGDPLLTMEVLYQLS